MESISGYTPKELSFGEHGRSRLIKGITKIADAVRSTLGPMGNTVLIESTAHTHGITVTKDGVTVAGSIDLLDPVENLAVRIMKEAAERTSIEAGDGTTTAIVLAEALVRSGYRNMVGNELQIGMDINRSEVLRALDAAKDVVIKELKSRSIAVTWDMLTDVAAIAANNDREIGKIIAEAYKAVGKDGIVTVEKSQTTDTYSETTRGMRIQRGYTSNLFINDHKRDECVFEDTYVMVCDTEINNILSIENVLKPIIQQGKRLLIIAPCSNNVVNTFAANVMRNNLKICNIMPPSFGYKQHELMQDIAVAVGARYFSERTGDDLSLMSLESLGHAAKTIVGRHSTIILTDENGNNDKISERVTQLKAALEETTKKEDKDFIMERIATLSGGIGVIYVGGNTDLEQKELFDRVDDSVCAVRSALEEGIVAGGGKALFEIKLKESGSREQRIASRMLNESIRMPLVQILDNAGLNVDSIYGANGITYEKGHGYDVKTGRIGKMIDMGIIDPLKVTRCALENAVSVASTILSTNAIITIARSYDTTGTTPSIPTYTPVSIT